MVEDSDFKKITIVGCGLIGGSIGLALKKSNYFGRIFGIDKIEKIEKAIRVGAIDVGSEKIEIGIKDADVVILATPIIEIIRLINRIKPFLSKKCLITDTGSTKVEIIRKAKSVFLNNYNFIGGHPMAGSEKGGIENAHPDLFVGKPYIVVPVHSNSNQRSLADLRMSSIIHCIGAIEIKMEANEHDRLVALISHLPQLIAVMMTNMLGSLVEEKNNERYFKISGNVFNEMTRVAQSPFSIWGDIYQTNRNWTMAFIDEIECYFEKVKRTIARNPAELEGDFKKASYIKEKMLKLIDNASRIK